MTVQRGGIGHWLNARAEQEFSDLDAALRQEAWQRLREGGWPAPPTEIDVETRFGTTHCYRWRGEGLPIVLLHGAGTSSLMWTPLLGQLVGRSVYALDLIGDPGRSVQRAPIRDADEIASWLDEVLDGLHLDQVHLMGSSYGGWIAIHLALRASERAATLTLLDPVLETIRPFFFVHGIACGIALLMPAPIRHWAARRLHMNGLAIDDKRVRRWAFLGQAKYRRGAPKFAPFTDTELASVTTTTLLLLGQKSQVHRSGRVADRARLLMPRVDAEVVPWAGHSLPVDQAQEIGPRIRAFLGRESAHANRGAP